MLNTDTDLNNLREIEKTIHHEEQLAFQIVLNIIW